MDFSKLNTIYFESYIEYIIICNLFTLLTGFGILLTGSSDLENFFFFSAFDPFIYSIEMHYTRFHKCNIISVQISFFSFLSSPNSRFYYANQIRWSIVSVG